MGFTISVSIRATMKLFSLFITTTLAKDDVDRMFSDRPEFITGNVQGWDNSRVATKFGELDSETRKYFKDFLAPLINNSDAQRAADKMQQHFEKAIGNIGQAAGLCYGNRKKRATDDNTRWALTENQGNKVAFNGLLWQYGNFIRQVIAPNKSKKCSKLALRLYRRLDRFNFIWKWHTCTKGISPESSDCDWAAFHTNGKPRDNHPRKGTYLETAFGKDADQRYRVTACDSENEDYQKAASLSCPLGGKIQIIRALYGRENSGECSKNPSGNFEICRNYQDVVEEAEAACKGESECTFSYSNTDGNDPCPGIEKFTKILYSCE